MKKLFTVILLTALAGTAQADCDNRVNEQIEVHRLAHWQAAEAIYRQLNPFERYRVQRELSESEREQLQAHRQLAACAAETAPDIDRRRLTNRR